MNFITTALADHKIAHTLENIYLRKIKKIYFKIKKKVTGPTLSKGSNPIYLSAKSF
jgi:hypothetical protein